MNSKKIAALVVLVLYNSVYTEDPMVRRARLYSQQSDMKQDTERKIKLAEHRAALNSKIKNIDNLESRFDYALTAYNEKPSIHTSSDMESALRAIVSEYSQLRSRFSDSSYRTTAYGDIVELDDATNRNVKNALNRLERLKKEKRRAMNRAVRANIGRSRK